MAAFTVLCEQYQPSLRRDPSYSDYLAKIGQLFFGVAAPRPRAPGFIGNIFLNNSILNKNYIYMLIDSDLYQSEGETP